MNQAFVWGVSLAMAGAVWGQHYGRVIGGGYPPRTYGSPHGFGNVLFPGTGTAPSIPNPIYRHPTTFAQRLGATISGYPGYTPGSRRFGHGGGLAVPYAVPIVVGGYGYGYGYEPPQAPAVTVVNPPQTAPQVIINQYYTPDRAQPVMRDYTDVPLPEASPARLRTYQAPIPSHPEPAKETHQREDKPTIYLIAFKDGAIYSAYGYWIDRDTLHYITTKGSHNRASLSLVDREVSERLNKERNVEFTLEKE